MNSKIVHKYEKCSQIFKNGHETKKVKKKKKEEERIDRK